MHGVAINVVTVSCHGGHPACEQGLLEDAGFAGVSSSHRAFTRVTIATETKAVRAGVDIDSCRAAGFALSRVHTRPS